jgi:hypothetical protein
MTSRPMPRRRAARAAAWARPRWLSGASWSLGRPGRGRRRAGARARGRHPPTRPRAVSCRARGCGPARRSRRAPGSRAVGPRDARRAAGTHARRPEVGAGSHAQALEGPRDVPHAHGVEALGGAGGRDAARLGGAQRRRHPATHAGLRAVRTQLGQQRALGVLRGRRRRARARARSARPRRPRAPSRRRCPRTTGPRGPRDACGDRDAVHGSEHAHAALSERGDRQRRAPVQRLTVFPGAAVEGHQHAVLARGAERHAQAARRSGGWRPRGPHRPRGRPPRRAQVRQREERLEHRLPRAKGGLAAWRARGPHAARSRRCGACARRVGFVQRIGAAPVQRDAEAQRVAREDGGIASRSPPAVGRPSAPPAPARCPHRATSGGPLDGVVARVVGARALAPGQRRRRRPTHAAPARRALARRPPGALADAPWAG